MPQKSQAEDALLRRGKWTYISALLLIAALALASHLVADSIIRREADTARIINLAGRQRMLSQRIVKVALERTLHRGPRGDAGSQRILRESVERMAAVHQGLLHGSAALNLQPSPPSVLAVYTGPEWQLDARVERFLSHARVLATQPADRVSVNDPDLLELEEDARSPLLDALDAAVVANQQFSEQSIQNLRARLAAFTGLTLLILLAEALFLYRPLFRRLTHHQKHMAHVGRTDPLTGCLNRRAFDEMAAAAFARARRSGEPLTLLLLDLDHFKKINDTYGHPAGDHVLQTTVDLLLQAARASDQVFRIGGEEFAILLPDCAAADAYAVASRFRKVIAAAEIPLPAAHPAVSHRMTTSVGVATLHEADLTNLGLLLRADTALYAAKRAGRNRVELAPAPQELSTLVALPTSLPPGPGASVTLAQPAS